MKLNIPISIRAFPVLMLMLFFNVNSKAQTCTAGSISGSTNFSSLSWTASGGASCPPTSPFTGNIAVSLGNGDNLIMDSDFTVNGDFIISTTGSNPTITVGAGIDMVVTGDMGNSASNNVIYEVDGTLQVDGTISSRNNAAFQGSGNISGGTLDVNNGTTCSSPCPVEGGFTACNSGDSFCEDFNVVLPIELLFFSGKVKSDHIKLSWATASEENFDYFLIQRSADVIKFDSVGTVQGAGNSSSILNYSFADAKAPIGRNYYRLKSIDLDGSYEYSKLITIDLLHLKSDWRIYPNPVSSNKRELFVEAGFNVEHGASLTIFDQNGRPILQSALKTSKQRIILPGNMEQGLYVVELLFGDQVFMRNLIVN